MGRAVAGLIALVVALASCRATPEPAPQPLPAVDVRPALLRPGPRSPRIASYRIEARLDVDRHRVEATQTLTWENRSSRAVDSLPFHLYMNAFKNEESVFMRETRGRHRGARASADGWGWIEVPSIRIRGEELRDRARFPGPDETVLEVPLSAPVEPGETVEVEMTFTTQLPRAFARTGYVGELHMVAQWFPKIGVLTGEPGAERWHAEPFHALSEFFADFGVYDVEVTVPRTHVVAATGVLARAEDHADGTRTLAFRAEDVHDFAWVADPYLERISDIAHTEDGPVEVRVYFRDPQRAFAERHLAAGVAAIEIFSRDYLPYPWTRMSILSPPPEAASSVGGMEYPTLVTTAGDHALTPRGIYLPEFVTIHEVGHNWFQGILASNEVDEAWLDEGVNDYANASVLEELYGRRTSLVDRFGYHADFMALRGALGTRYDRIPDPIAQPSHHFVDPDSYFSATYGKTAAALRTLEHAVGSDRFRAALRAYARRWAFKHPTGADFFSTLEEELGQDLGWFVEPAFHRRGTVHFRVRSIECRPVRPPRGVFGTGADRAAATDPDPGDGRPHDCEVVVENLGEVPAPADIEIRFEDGSHVEKRWDDLDRWRWQRFEIRRQSRIAAVVIDPGRKVPLDVGALERAERVVPARGAARRAAARAQFWTQTLMQVTGL
jgi:hypothetical protein